jgi:branched-chain amino acid transport system ATP-binding protein
MAPLLEVRGLGKRFGGLQAVQDVSFRVEPGAVKAIIGPNGAGKTTLFNLISGVTAPDAGQVTFQGQAIQGRRPHQVAALGLSRTFQQIRLFSGMSALENVMVGAHVRGRAGFLAGLLHLPWTWREERALTERAREALDFMELAEVADDEATSLSYGQQRGVELARALAAGPRLLLLDEPAAGLNMRETADLSRLIGRLKTRDVTVLLVEHDMSLVMEVSDEVAVLSFGQKIADAAPQAVQRDPEVIRVYLGDDEC